MIKVVLALLLITSATSAEVYKSVDAQGLTQFSDRRQPDAETLDIKTAQPSDPNKQALVVDGQSQAPLLGPYTQFEIVFPEPNQTLRQAQPEVPVSLILDPLLVPEHRLEIVLDGTSMTVEKSAGTQIKLTGIVYGSHNAQAQVRDAQGNIVARTPAVPFHLRKPIPPGVIQ